MKEKEALKIAIIGGGAAGFFAALAAKEANSEAEVAIYEKSAKLLSKVRISGGGRCNVTHACFDPHLLVQNYPRGHQELLGPFHRFQPRNTIEWFAQRGVELHTERDGRMFPTTNSSQTIIDCLLGEAKKLGVEIHTRVKAIPTNVDRLILATGSSPEGWEWAKERGHTIQPPVPSLFTLNIPHFALADLAGIAVHTHLRIDRLESSGPLLITHWGFSGPAALKLSAFGARYLAEKQYKVPLY
ncbi:MAG: aminoacetone oxidase family FAD-binding enzyme, partial [Chlamydiales bacterium]